MAILQCNNSIVGTVGIVPNFVFINTNDTPATVTTAGYLNHVVQEGLLSVSNTDVAFVNTVTAGVSSVLLLQVSITGLAPALVYSLITPVNSGGSIFAGNVQAGLNGTAGAFLSFPAALNTGHLTLSATANGGAFNTLITNAALGQTTTFTIPDPGNAAASFLLTRNAGIQTIATGGLTLTLGNLQVTAGTIVGGTAITAGINNASAGSFVAIPAGNNQGSLRLVPVANAGNFASTLSNRNIGQATVYSLPDAANAIASVLVGATATPFTANHIMVASGTGGLVADAGYQMKTVAGAVVGGGAAAQVVVDAFVTAASNIVASWNTQANAASILTVTPGVGQFTVTSTVDPGASTLNYIVTKV